MNIIIEIISLLVQKPFYSKITLKNIWFFHLDLPKLNKFPYWFAYWLWLKDFGHQKYFLSYYVNKKYEIFNKRLFPKCKNIFFIS